MPVVDNPLLLSPNSVWRERRAFAYYFQNAAPSLCGLDVDFWRTVVPQLCRTEPAVWDAINSLSALFESPETPSQLVPQRQEYFHPLSQNHRDALAWYSRSVSVMRQRIERGDVDIIVGLVSCILFICIETVQGGMEASLQLYTQGVHLILALRAQIASGSVSAEKAALLEDTIVPIFLRLGAVALTISKIPVIDLLPHKGHGMAPHFATLRSAREEIVLLAAEIQIFERTCSEHMQLSPAGIPSDWEDKRVAFSVRLGNWHTGFVELIGGLPGIEAQSPQQIGTVALLVAHHEMLSIILETCLCPSPLQFDNYYLNFQSIVEQASIALDASARSDGTQPPFAFEIGVGLPVWFTCLRCREPRIRRKALDLLRRAPQVQGFYKCLSGVIIGEKIMALEETFGKALNAAQTADPKALDSQSESSNQLIEYRSSHHGGVTDVSSLDFHSLAASESQLHPVPMDRGNGAPEDIYIPAEARIIPMGIFQPQDGLPPGTMESDVMKWKQSPDQTLLRFLRHGREWTSGNWQMVYGYAPIDFRI